MVANVLYNEGHYLQYALRSQGFLALGVDRERYKLGTSYVRDLALFNYSTVHLGGRKTGVLELQSTFPLWD